MITEIIFAICITLSNLGVLYFFTRQQQKQTEHTEKVEQLLVELPEGLHSRELKKDEERNKLLGKMFTDYLKHIYNLEKMVLPKPVTQRDVEAILARAPELAEVENEIDKTDNEDTSFALNESNFAKVLFNEDTKVEFEEDLPTEIE